MEITLINPKNKVETRCYVEPDTMIVFIKDGFCGGSTGLTIAQWSAKGFVTPTIAAAVIEKSQ